MCSDFFLDLHGSRHTTLSIRRFCLLQLLPTTLCKKSSTLRNPIAKKHSSSANQSRWSVALHELVAEWCMVVTRILLTEIPTLSYTFTGRILASRTRLQRPPPQQGSCGFSCFASLSMVARGSALGLNCANNVAPHAFLRLRELTGAQMNDGTQLIQAAMLNREFSTNAESPLILGRVAPASRCVRAAVHSRTRHRVEHVSPRCN